MIARDRTIGDDVSNSLKKSSVMIPSGSDLISTVEPGESMMMNGSSKYIVPVRDKLIWKMYPITRFCTSTLSETTS